MKKTSIIFAMVFMVLFSCKKEEKTKCIVIDIANTINTKELKQFSLDDIAQEIRLIPIETTDSILFGNVFIVGVTEEYIVVCEGTFGVEPAVYFINKTNGKVSSIINRYGRGPGEYIRIAFVSLNKRDETIYLSDLTKTNEYTFDGKLVNSFQNDSIGMLRMLKDGNFAVSYRWTNTANTEFALGIYDSSWNLKRKGMPKAEKNIKFDMIYTDGTIEFNDECFYRLAHSDTLYRITSEFDEPYLVYAKGKYRLPIEIKASREKTKKEGYRYIRDDSGMLISKYDFLSFYYNNKLYYDVWNIENSSLMYRSIYSREGGVYGIPITVNEKKIYVWPTFVSKDAIYCTIEGEDAINLIPSLLEDSNPVILEIRL